jgi:hypothetical protein
MIPLIQARRRFNPPLLTPLDVALISSYSSGTNAASHTMSSNLGDGGSFQYWLCATGGVTSSGTLTGVSATLDGEAMAECQALDTNISGRPWMHRIFAISGYTDGGTVDVVLTYTNDSLNATMFLLRTNNILSTTPYDTDAAATGAGGTQNITLDVPSGGFAMGSARSTEGVTLTGLDHIVHNNVQFSYPAGDVSTAYHDGAVEETLAIAVNNGAATGDWHSWAFASFGPTV